MAYAVAQISDLHIVAAGRRLADVIDTASYTRAAVDFLNRLDPQQAADIVSGIARDLLADAIALDILSI